MGRRARGGFSRMLNLTPKSVSNARKIKLSLLERVEPLLKGQVITTPLWYDAMKAHPPLPKSGWTKKPRLLEFPEDKLKRVWLRRNPGATMHAKSLFHEEEGLHASQHPADAFVKRQMELMRKGMDEDDAYRQTVKQQEQQTVASPEATEALAAARAFGATPGNEAAGETGEAAATSSGSGSGSGLLKQALLRKFAEEAREAKLPYPSHWFDKNGNWTGIPTTPSPSAASRRRSAATDELEEELSKVKI